MNIRYFVKLAYDGTAYHGWQIQDNALTVQEVLQKAFSMVLRQPIDLTGCGRTDTGVHAREFFAHFDIDSKIQDTENLAYKINGLIPHDIVVHYIKEVRNDVHARFSAIRRMYIYMINSNRNPFNREYEYYFRTPLNVELMNQACKILMEYKDFSCFSKTQTQVDNFMCDIFEAKWTSFDNKTTFIISANRFLRNMVRAIVGTMMDVGLGKINLEEFREIIENGNRSDAGASVPAKGLFLYVIEYPEQDDVR